MKSFVELFEIILSGNKESSRLAAREVRKSVNELGPLTVHLRCPDSNYSRKLSRADADQILANMFIALINLANNFWKPTYKKYKYISSLPSGPYKSIQMVLSELEDDCGEQFMLKLHQKFKTEVI